MNLKRFSLFLLFSYFSFLSFSQEPFICDGTVYFYKTNNTIPRLSQLHFDWEADEISQTTLSGTLPFEGITALGYNVVDNFIYGIGFEPDVDIYYLLKIDSSGNATILTSYTLNPGWGIGGGDITKEGEFILYMGKTSIPMPDSSFIAIGKIDLNTDSYELSIDKMQSQIGESGFFTYDMAFDPITDSLYSYTRRRGLPSDPMRQLLLIDINTPSINSTAFPLLTESFGWLSPFFDPFGNLWGFDYWSMYKVNKNTGSIEKKQGSGTFYVGDACSCPYTLSMQKTASQDTVYPCAEVVYTFKIANLATDLQEDIDFRDSLPIGFQALEVIRNPYGGVVGGIGSDELTIVSMDIPYGVDSIMIKVLVPEDGDGLYYNQAQLSNVDVSAGNNPETVFLSDYPFTPEKRDATPIFIDSLVIDISGDILELCPDSTIILQPFGEVDGVEYLWSTGSKDSILYIREAGIYGVTVTVNCLTDSAHFEVFLSDLSADLGDSEGIIYGDVLEIEALVHSTAPLGLYYWQLPDTLSCFDCPIIEITPTTSGLIHLEVVNEAGCHVSALQFIDVDRPVYVPNAFSPNDDGINDLFYIQTKHPVRIKKWQIFNRWGDLVFQKEDIFTNVRNDGWDGRFKGKRLDQGIYVWSVELEYAEGEDVIMTGDVLILSE